MSYTASVSNIIDEASIRQIQEYIDQSRQIVITAHLSPDGDALGSSLALCQYLQRQGKKAEVMVPNSFPYFLKWMEGAEKILIYEHNSAAGRHHLEQADLIFSLDYNILKRVGDIGPVIAASPAQKVLIDHHPYPDTLFDVTVSHPEISSTSELIFRLLFQMGEYEGLTREEAACIYCGMMTDTGAFTYNSSNPEIYEIISLLLRKNIDKDAIYSNVYNNYSENRFRLLGFTLSQRMKIYPESHAALIYLSREDQKPFHFSKGDTEGFVNYPLSIKNIIFSTFIREDDDLIKLSFRSQKNFACNEFAAEFFGGGGHLNASGGEFHGTMEDALQRFESGLEKYREKLKKNNL